ncbi:cyclin-dependent kinase 14-like isoform X4 [Portunus trituberculatus]|uniref:cyclin-dependent kinase 14-like isoform X4 n=1 Tax=Portunus trituberculatus TaxID=210409 RepID=UPI001E1CF13A|nr:cyclin-dependent kinase 14-like isoform X4 [Portunus trituberculatus]
MLPAGKEEVVMREKKGGALSKVQKLKRRISNSFGKLGLRRKRAISKTEVFEPEYRMPAFSKSEDFEENGFRMSAISKNDDDEVSVSGMKINGFSDEYLDRIEPNGNIPDKDCGSFDRWERLVDHRESLSRQLSVSSDSKLLDEDLRSEQKVIMRPKKPPRPKSEVYLCKDTRKSKRFSAFGGDSPFGRTEAYMKLDQLGEGSYATVYKGYSNLTNQVVALKEIRLQEEEGAPFTAIREASLLKQLKHANIVTLHDIIHTRETLTFVFEYVHTDLSQYLEKHGGGLHPRNVKLLLFQLLRGLSYCHRRRILHRDIKPQNLLISEIGELKIADFGLARAKSVPSHTYSHEVVTLWYRPPDVLLGSTDYSTSLDMWGVGCIFTEMITGVPAFPGVRDIQDQLDKIFKVVGTPTEETWTGVTQLPNYKPHRLVLHRPRRLANVFPRLNDIPHAESLATQFLQIQPNKRISSEAALRHTYFDDLPQQIYELDADQSIFSVGGVRLAQELRNYPTSVIQAAREIRKLV